MNRSIHTVACAAPAAVSTLTAQHDRRDIVATAVQAGQFKTLATALQAAGLVDALQGKGPFTVFAPTDAAFAKLPKGTVESLLEKRNRDRLTAILKFHVVAGELAAADVTARRGAITLNGQRATFAADDGGVTVAGGQVVKTDIRCSNGIIHVIDRVLIPATDDIVELASKAGKFATLLAAAKAAGLAGALGGDGPFTVFAPTDAAFAKLPKGTVESLLEKRNLGKLAAILKYHVVPGRSYSDALVASGGLKTLQGAALSVAIRDGRLTAGDARVVMNDLDARNGVVHVIDSVLMPPMPEGRKVIGVYVENVSAALAAQLRLQRDRALLVTGFSGKNASEAGLQKYDVITHIAGRPATEANLDRAKDEAGFGAEIELRVLRGGQKATVRVPVQVARH